jgi:hypothetical protein
MVGGDYGVRVFVFCGVVLIVCNRIMYCRSFKLGAHNPSPSYITTLYST